MHPPAPPAAKRTTVLQGEKAGPPGRSPKLPLNFHATRPDTSGLKEHSPKGASDPPGGVAERATLGAGSREQALRSASSER